MADFNPEHNRLTLKLVYYGPAQSGKTTNLMQLHDLLIPEFKGEIMILDTQNDRTLFFDLLPLGFTTPAGMLIKFKIFTVPGQVVHDSTRKAILSRADGVVFVADSQSNQGVNNAESFRNLELNTARVGLDMTTLPMVIQFNKRDLNNITPEQEVRDRWEPAPWPLHLSSAITGDGVKETFASLLGQLYDNLNEPYKLSTDHRLGRSDFVQGIVQRIE